MSDNLSLSPEQKAQIAQQIGQAEQWLNQKEQMLRVLQQQLLGTKKNKQQEIQNQIFNAQREYDSALQHVNMLRAQIGSPLIIPNMNPGFPPQQPFMQQAAVPQKKRSGCLIGIGIIVAITLIGAAARNGEKKEPAAQLLSKTNTPAAAAGNPSNQESSNTEGSASGTEKATTAPAAESAPAAFTIGQDIKVGDVRWKILGAEDVGQTMKSDNQFIKDATTEGKYVAVGFEIENLSKEQLQFSDVEIIDSEARTFKSSSDFNVLSLIPDNKRCTFLEPLQSNLPKTCLIIFELPKTAQGLKLMVGDLEAFTDDSAQIELGF